MIRSIAMSSRLGRLRNDVSGVSIVEFALILPILVVIGFWGIETANFAIANLRVSQIAALTADNAGRVRDSIDEADVNELLTGAKMVGTGIDFAARGRIIPATARSRLVLPAPLRPRRAVALPALSSRLNPSNSKRSPRARANPSILTFDITTPGRPARVRQGAHGRQGLARL